MPVLPFKGKSTKVRCYLIFISMLLLLLLGQLYAAEVAVKRHAVLREDARGSSPRKGTAEPGEYFTLVSTETTNHWYPVEYRSDTVWIYSRFVDVVAEPVGEEVVRIASFNTLHLGWNNNKDYDKVAEILTKYDLIALQEVMKEEGLRTLLQQMNAATRIPGYDTVWYPVISETIGRNSYKEAYAFIWRKDRVEFIEGSDAVYNDVGDRFSREPYVASFRAGQFDFTLISAHFIFGDRVRDREAEAEAVADVFRWVRDSKAEKDILLMGDYNLSPESAGWTQLKNLGNMHWILNPPTKTSIGTSGMSKLYDNIWFQENFVQEYSNISGNDEFMHEHYEEDQYVMARTYVSDHVPIYAVFRTDLPDDD